MPLLMGDGRIAASLAASAAALLLAGIAMHPGEFPPGYRPPERLLYFPVVAPAHSMPHAHALADLLWMRTLAYFGGHFTGDRDFRHLARMLDVVTRLHPRFRPAYSMAASVLPWMAGAVRDSRLLLIRAMVHLPEEGRWAYELGLNFYLFNNDRGKAAHYLRRAVERGFVNPLSASLATSMQAAAGGLGMARLMLLQAMKRTSDARMRSFLREQLRRVDTEAILRRLESELGRLRKRRRIQSLAAMRRLGLRWPQTLPDGGRLVMDRSGTLHSSASPRRLRLAVSRHHP